MLCHFPVASLLDNPDRRALVLKAATWGPPGETLGAVAAKLLHGELIAYLHRPGAPDEAGTGIALLEFDPLGVLVNLAYVATDRPGVLPALLDELADLAQRYGFQALECYSRRPGMGRLLVRLGWQTDPSGPYEPLPGFQRFLRPLPEEKSASGRRVPSWLRASAQVGRV